MRISRSSRPRPSSQPPRSSRQTSKTLIIRPLSLPAPRCSMRAGRPGTSCGSSMLPTRAIRMPSTPSPLLSRRLPMPTPSCLMPMASMPPRWPNLAMPRTRWLPHRPSTTSTTPRPSRRPSRRPSPRSRRRLQRLPRASRRLRRTSSPRLATIPLLRARCSSSAVSPSWPLA